MFELNGHTRPYVIEIEDIRYILKNHSYMVNNDSRDAFNEALGAEYAFLAKVKTPNYILKNNGKSVFFLSEYIEGSSLANVYHSVLSNKSNGNLINDIDNRYDIIGMVFHASYLNNFDAMRRANYLITNNIYMIDYNLIFS